MSFRQFGGLKYSSKHNVVSSNLNSSNQLFVTQNVGQPNSVIDFLSDISGNITIYGNLDISGNAHISGNLDVSGNENISGNLDVLGNLDVSGNVDISGNVDVSGNLTAYYMFLSSGTNYNTDNNAVMPKSYIDLAAAGINIVGKVYATSDVSLNISMNISPLNIDGIQVPSGNNVLLTGQTNAVDNGVYYYNGTNLTRSTTILATGADAVGALVIVLYGNLYAKSGWLQTYKNPNTGMAEVGTDPLDFTEFYSFNFKLGNGLVSTNINNVNYISVDPSLNYMYKVDGSNNALSLGTRTTTTGLNFGSSTNQIPVSFNGAISPLPLTVTTSSNSAQISFTWTIPSLYTNISTSLQQLNAVLYANIYNIGPPPVTTIKTYPVIQNLSTNLNTLDEIIIAKTNPNNYHGLINNSTAYFYYSPDFANMQSDPTNNIMILWYSNYGPYPNISNIPYASFSSAVPPTSDASFNNTPYSTTTTSTSNPNPNCNLTLTYNPPTALVTSGSSTGVNLVSFQTDLSISSNSVRYGGAPTQTISDISLNYTVTYDSSFSAIYGNGSGTNNPSTLYPDCSYNFYNLKSTNSLSATSAANPATFGPYYTAPLQILNTLTPTNSSYNISNYNNNLIATTAISGTIYKVSDNTTVSPVYNNQNISSTSVGPFSINYNQNSRGTLGQGFNLMNIYISVLNSNLAKTDISCNGFPTTNNPQISDTDISLNSITPLIASDQYSVTGFTGYYLQIPAFNATIPSSLDASNNAYSFLFSQKYLDTSGNIIGAYNASQNFYYDNLGTLQNLNITNFTLASQPGITNTLVSGINIVGTGTIYFSITTTIDNLAHYFYYVNPLSYTFGGGLNAGSAAETSLANGTNTSGNNWTIISDVSGNVNTNTNPYFTTITTVSVKARSIQNPTGLNSLSLTDLSGNPIIYDVPSYSLLNNTSYTPVSIQTVTNLNAVGKPGYRIWSAPDSTSVQSSTSGSITTNVTIPPYYSSQGSPNSDYSYSLYPYSQAWSIVNTSTSVSASTYPATPSTINTNYEIQVYNGHYGTGLSSDASGNNGYINYNNYYNNTLSYSGVSRTSTSYRYATFVWKLSPGSGQTAINKYNFTFYNMDISGSPITDISGSSAPFYFTNSTQTTRFFLFYRTEQISNNSPVTIPSSSNSSTSIWVDGNNTYGTSTGPTLDSSIGTLSSSNYFDPSDNSIVRAASSINAIVSSNNFTMSVSAIPCNYSTSASNYVYCRFGLPMGANVTYDYVTFSIS